MINIVPKKEPNSEHIDSLDLIKSLKKDSEKLTDTETTLIVLESASAEIKRLRLENSLLRGGLLHIYNVFKSSGKSAHDRMNEMKLYTKKLLFQFGLD